MAHIVMLGAGVMSASLCVPLGNNGHKITVIGSPYDKEAISTLGAVNSPSHPALDVPLPACIQAISDQTARDMHFSDIDALIIGVSSPGISWANDLCDKYLRSEIPLVYLTKGLFKNKTDPAFTLRDVLPKSVKSKAQFVTIGGPCIARELAMQCPSSAIVASEDSANANLIAHLLRTPYYRPHISTDAVGVAAASALKNVLALGVSAIATQYKDDKTGLPFHNPVASAFSQALTEMADLIEFLGGERTTALGLAGEGDLQVTITGGRNARAGAALGEGLTPSQALDGPLKGMTIEGIDTAKTLAHGLMPAFQSNELPLENFPMTRAILDCVTKDTCFSFDFASIGRV